MQINRFFLFSFVNVLAIAATANAGTFTLNATAADSSTFYEYFSAGFSRISLDAPPNEFRQRFHSIPDPSVGYGPLDVFPHDNDMRFGAIQYDDSTLVGGTGTASITGLTLGVTADPFDPTYLNLNRFTATTVVDSYHGTISLINGVVSSIDLAAEVSIHFPTYLASTLPAVYSGDFTLSADTFSVAIRDTQFIDPVFAPAGADVELEWALSGTINGVVTSIPGDLNHDGFVGQDDLSIILGLWGQEVTLGSKADPSNDGFVGQDDLNSVLGSWGNGTPLLLERAVAIPEVSSSYLLSSLLGCCLVARRFRSRPIAA